MSSYLVDRSKFLADIVPVRPLFRGFHGWRGPVFRQGKRAVLQRLQDLHDTISITTTGQLVIFLLSVCKDHLKIQTHARKCQFRQ